MIWASDHFVLAVRVKAQVSPNTADQDYFLRLQSAESDDSDEIHAIRAICISHDLYMFWQLIFV